VCYEKVVVCMYGGFIGSPAGGGGWAITAPAVSHPVQVRGDLRFGRGLEHGYPALLPRFELCRGSGGTVGLIAGSFTIVAI